jgi:hypothetical protein
MFKPYSTSQQLVFKAVTSVDYRGARIAVEPLAFGRVRVYVNGRLFAQGTNDLAKHFLERAKEHVDYAK